eukprot:m.215136 g.215136  ORF g.215136 m.215136 type:complete len:192 (+) comp54069_c0_seq11:2718-3293(+)
MSLCRGSYQNDDHMFASFRLSTELLAQAEFKSRCDLLLNLTLAFDHISRAENWHEAFTTFHATFPEFFNFEALAATPLNPTDYVPTYYNHTLLRALCATDCLIFEMTSILAFTSHLETMILTVVDLVAPLYKFHSNPFKFVLHKLFVTNYAALEVCVVPLLCDPCLPAFPLQTNARMGYFVLLIWTALSQG